MIPAALAAQLELGLADFLRMSFWSSTPGMEGVIEQLIQTPGGLFKGPYVSVKLPFQQGSAGEYFPKVPLGFPAHKHQQAAFARMSGDRPRSTLVATGTGSGKTESFLWPILDHCRQQVGKPGIKAIIIYPMNALATDQAGRMARAIHSCPNLRGAVRAGLYIGESPGEKRQTHKSMGPDHLITDRTRMKLDPPDILLTNYKMLDYLLVRPKDQQLWQHNGAGPLRFLVVDELHTFDGAQGTDLACLIRRLKARLGVESGQLCCVGTSATLGGGEAVDTLREYAEDIFGEPFDSEAVVGEQRVGPGAFFGDQLIEFHTVPSGAPAALDPTAYPDPQAYVLAQQALWFEEEIDAEPFTNPWRVALGAQLGRHGILYNLVKLLSKGPTALDRLVAEISRTSRDLRDNPELARLAIVSMLSLVSESRSWMPEGDDAQTQRASKGRPRPTRPFLEVRLQVWQRELRRMVADIAPQPTLRFSDDLNRDQREQHLPMLHCRDCGAMGWATLQSRDKPGLYRTSLDQFYRGFFSNDPQVCFLWPAAAAPSTGDWVGARTFALGRESLVRVPDEDADPETTVPVVVSPSLVTEKGRQKLSRDCPFCAARGSLTLLGFRAATLTSVFIDQLFASPFNDDKKLLTFSDSVQDAAHRAGFFGARTWRFNLRVALQAVLSETDDIALDALPLAFSRHWRGPNGLPDVEYVSTFLAPNMEWFQDYELMQESGKIPVGSKLLHDVDRRIAFEIFTEFGHQSRIGRSLPRSGAATTSIDPVALDKATDRLLEPLRNQVGGLRALDQHTLRRFLLGALHHLRERGGILHSELPPDFILSGGRDTYVFKRWNHLPAFGRTSRMPALLTNDGRSPRFDTLTHKTGDGSWYERWASVCLGPVATLMGPAIDVWTLVLPSLVEQGLLDQQDGKNGRVWGVDPGALRVRGEVVRMRCGTCAHWQVVAAAEREGWVDMPCLTARCAGHYVEEAAGPDYFGRLYRQGEVERVFTAEHTGLLTRGVREAVEKEFKAEADKRQPWFPNLLSCTPTLEMGIDIGALSSAILCSVPPGQANYLQRIGRAGRRDGNSLLLTIVQARPHDLYFFARPEEMLAGDVRPPGVFLNASAVLERQLAAYCLDCWNAEGVPADAIPNKLTAVFEHLEDEGPGRFPHNWLTMVKTRETAILDGFFALFGATLSDDSRAHLRAFLCGDHEDEGSLGWKVLDVLRGERNQRDSLRDQLREVTKEHRRLTEAKAQNKDHEDELRDHKREIIALQQLIKQIESNSVLQFLTDQGLLPNYAFPESPIRLRSVIWRRKQTLSKKDKSAYETHTYEYARPAMAAISELAPDNRFFAGGRHVTIDQVDVGTAKMETWRFCDLCTYSTRIDHEDLVKSCPQCQSPVWGEESQTGQLLKLEQVFANTSDRQSRIRDDQDDRQPRHYNRHMLMSFQAKDRDGAWHIDDPAVPFGFEFIRRARFQEINFGEFTDNGTKTTIAGREEARRGFVICKHCGKVQPKPPPSAKTPPPKPQHTLWCPARKKTSDAGDYEAAIYLYREFSSEALRLLLPLSEIGTERQLSSFMAAFQLGLRAKYGGKVDHLHTLVYSEPEQGGQLRRQYLALYDSVPGGTGYLKDFTRQPEDTDQPHPLFDILQRALDRMRTCVCNKDPDLDGCYSCLFAYRNSRDQSETSRQTAESLLDRILGQRDKLEAVDRLSDVSVSGMMDSVLEARFIEALRRMNTGPTPVRVEKAIVRNKPGYRLLTDNMVWLIEQQSNLGRGQGMHPDVSIDFVFHHAEGGETRRQPIAVFLDGFQYHRDRVSRDLHQRMALLRSGRFDVWSFTWYDIDEAFHDDVKPAPILVHSDLKVLKAWLGRLGIKTAASLFERPILEAFRDVLGPTPTQAWDTVATSCLIAQMRPPGEVDFATWSAEVRHHAPTVAAPWFAGIGPDALCVHRPPTPEQPFGLWAAAPATALSPQVRANEFRLLAWLDDRPDRRNNAEFRQTWRGFLHLFQVLRTLPHGWFVGTEANSEDYRFSAATHQPPAELVAEVWDGLDIDPEFAFVVDALRKLNVPLPQVGIDLLDARGHTIAVEAELLWEDLKLAVVETMEDAEGPPAPGWTVLTRDALLEDIQPLLDALTDTAGVS